MERILINRIIRVGSSHLDNVGRVSIKHLVAEDAGSTTDNMVADHSQDIVARFVLTSDLIDSHKESGVAAVAFFQRFAGEIQGTDIVLISGEFEEVIGVEFRTDHVGSGQSHFLTPIHRGNTVDLLDRTGVLVKCRSNDHAFISGDHGTVTADVNRHDLEFIRIFTTVVQIQHKRGVKTDILSRPLTGSSTVVNAVFDFVVVDAAVIGRLVPFDTEDRLLAGSDVFRLRIRADDLDLCRSCGIEDETLALALDRRSGSSAAVTGGYLHGVGTVFNNGKTEELLQAVDGNGQTVFRNGHTGDIIAILADKIKGRLADEHFTGLIFEGDGVRIVTGNNLFVVFQSQLGIAGHQTIEQSRSDGDFRSSDIIVSNFEVTRHIDITAIVVLEHRSGIELKRTGSSVRRIIAGIECLDSPVDLFHIGQQRERTTDRIPTELQ